MRSLRLTLAQKVLVLLTAVLIPILLAFLFTYRSQRRTIETILMHDLQTISNASEGYLLLSMDRFSARMTDFAHDGFILAELDKYRSQGPGDRRKTEGRLTEHLIENKMPLLISIYRVSIYSPEGVVLASTLPSARGQDMSGSDFFIRGREGVSITERDEGPMGGPEIAVSTPVKKNGVLLGVIAGFIPLSELQRIITGEELIRLGAAPNEMSKELRTLEVYIVNSRSLMLTESRLVKDSVLKQKVETKPVAACLSEGREVTGFYKDYRGVEVAGAAQCMSRFNWVLLAEVDKDEILLPAERAALYSILTVVLTVVLLGSLALVFLRLVVAQIRGLAAAAKTVSGGDYDVSIPVRGNDEISVLSGAFNNMARDIKQRTADLRDREATLNAILNSTKNVVYLKDLDGRHILVNHTLEELTGLGRDQIYGKTVFEIFPGVAAEVMRKNDLKALESGAPVEAEETIEIKGEQHTYLSVKSRLLDSSGKPYAVCGISTDVTLLKRAQEALGRSEKSLANAQRIARIGSWDWDVLKDELVWSEELYRIFSMKKEGFGGRLKDFLDVIHPEDKVIVENAIRDAMEKKRPFALDYRLLLPGGTEKIIHAQGEVGFDGQGRAVKMSGTAQDITERKFAEQEVRRLNEELERRVRERTFQLENAIKELESFSYSVAHDLRTPLRLIDGFSHLLYTDYKDKLDNRGRERLVRVRSASQRMGELIDDLLELSSVARAEIKVGQVDLSAMAASIRDELKKADSARVVDFIIEEGMRVEGDEKLLRILLENLIGNAWKFTSKRPSAKIEFKSSVSPDGRRAFCVIDNGAGFDMRYAGKLFSPFQRLHSSDEFPGTGVGLATVQRIIQRHGGEAWGTGEPDKGARFCFTL